MPLRKYRRGEVWWLRGTVKGQRVHETTGTSDEVRAEGLRIAREGEVWDGAVHGPARTATFEGAVISYLEAEPRSDKTKDYLERLVTHLGGTRLADIDQNALDRAYGALLRPGASAATRARAVLTPLRAVLEHAARRGLCARPAFERVRIPRARTPLILPATACRLVEGAASHLSPLLVFLFCTGCRVSETIELRWPAVDLRAARCTVWQKQGTERYVDLPPAAVAALSALPHREGFVFRPARHNSRSERHAEGGYRSTGRDGGGQLRTAWATACARAGVPGAWREYPRGDRPDRVHRRFIPEITPHDARHAWATWHYCVHRDLRRLQEDGGWDTVGMTVRYTRVMPATYRDEIIAFWNGTPRTPVLLHQIQHTDEGDAGFPQQDQAAS